MVVVKLEKKMAKYDEIAALMRTLSAAGLPPYSEQVFAVHAANGSRRLIVCSYTSCIQAFADLYSSTILSVDSEGNELYRAPFLGQASAEELFAKSRVFPLHPSLAKLDALSGRPISSFYADAFAKEASAGGFSVGSSRTALGLSGLAASPATRFMRDIVLLASGQDPLAYPMESMTSSHVPSEDLDQRIFGKKEGLYVRMNKEGSPVALAASPMVMPAYGGLTASVVEELTTQEQMPVYHMTDLFSELYLYKYSDPDFKGMPGYNSRYDYSRLTPEAYARNLFSFVLKKAGDVMRLDRGMSNQASSESSASLAQQSDSSAKNSFLSKISKRVSTPVGPSAHAETPAPSSAQIDMPVPPVEAYDSTEFSEEELDAVYVVPESYEAPAAMATDSLGQKSVSELRKMGVSPRDVGAEAPIKLKKPVLSSPRKGILGVPAMKGAITLSPSAPKSTPLFARPTPSSDASPFEQRPTPMNVQPTQAAAVRSSTTPVKPISSDVANTGRVTQAEASKTSGGGFMAKLKATKPIIDDAFSDGDGVGDEPSSTVSNATRAPRKSSPSSNLGF